MVRRIVPAAVALLLAAAPYASAQVQTVALFDASRLETPENIAIDHDNNKYVSLALTGEIRRIAPDGVQSTYARLPLGAPPLTFCGSFFAGLTGITFDEHDNLYANLASCDPGSRGVWKIPATGNRRRASLRSQCSRCRTASCTTATGCMSPTRSSARSGAWPTRGQGRNLGGRPGTGAGPEWSTRAERPEAVRRRTLRLESVARHRGRGSRPARRRRRRGQDARHGRLLRRLRVRRARQSLLRDRSVQHDRAHCAGRNDRNDPHGAGRSRWPDGRPVRPQRRRVRSRHYERRVSILPDPAGAEAEPPSPAARRSRIRPAVGTA